MAGRDYWTERPPPQDNRRYQAYEDRSYGGHRGGNNSGFGYYQSRGSSAQSSDRDTQAMADGTFCTLCQVTMYTNYEVQDHLASSQHLDMVVQYPMIPLTDVLVPASNVNTNEVIEEKVEGKDILEDLEYNLGTEAVNNIIMVRWCIN